jgi:hypothetical protein
MFRTITGIAVLAGLVLAACGCGQAPDAVLDPGRADLVTVQVPRTLDVAPTSTVPFASDIEDLYRVGVALSRGGRHLAAGHWFMEAARLESAGGRWAVACASAAACAYLQSGDMTAFDTAVETLKHALGRWGTLAPPPLAETVLALHGAANGSADRADLPRSVTNIFNWEVE